MAYLVYTTEPNTKPKITFALGKARVAPLKQHTITKLELHAALFGARIAGFIKQQQRFSLNHTYLWTDGSTILQWILGSDKRQQIFVANCVAEILELTQSTQWNNCPGYLNPADNGTRGIHFSEFNPNSRWFNGPDFLLQTEDAWPKPPFETASPSNTVESDRQRDCVFSDTEKKFARSTSFLLCDSLQVLANSSSCINYELFLKWNRLRRATVFVLIAAALFKNSTRKSSIDRSLSQTPHQKPHQHNLIQFPPSEISPPSTTEANRHYSITLNAYDTVLAMEFLIKNHNRTLYRTS